MRTVSWYCVLGISQLSVKSRFSVDGPLLSVGPSAIRGFFEEGSRLDTEPSMIWGINVEGSVLENGTVRDKEH